jgi:hypothetical protein
MESLTPAKVMFGCIIGFGAIIAANVLWQNRENQQFKAQFGASNRGQFMQSLRGKLNAQEHDEIPAQVEETAEEE